VKPKKIETLCLALPFAEKTHPFGPEPDVYKVGGKMFAIASPTGGGITLKCDPEYAAILVGQHEDIEPGYHTDKRHWITVDPTGTLDDGLIEDLIAESYHLVVAGLPKKVRAEIQAAP
jgi:predicted DNA-binding protein (MmcQ/YjbR family)